jgi:hypothetical protein
MHPEYAGMTTNERLFAAGLLEAFDEAARRRDREEMMRLLIEVELEPADAARTVEFIIADPRKYRF